MKVEFSAGPAPVTVRATNDASCDLLGQTSEAAAVLRHLRHVGVLVADMIEIQNDQVPRTAVSASGAEKNVADVLQVSHLAGEKARASIQDLGLKTPRAYSLRRSPPMAIDADHLADVEFGSNDVQRGTVPDKPAHVVPLFVEVVEFEQVRRPLSTIGACVDTQVARD